MPPLRCAALPPGAQLPFGLVRVGPDTISGDIRFAWRMPGGYSYCDSEVAAFSHTHLVGAGVTDLGNVGVIPVVNFTAARSRCFQPTVDGNDLRFCLFKQPFLHQSEIAEPGAYHVVLDDPAGPSAQIVANLTATQHAAHHRYVFPQGHGAPSLLFDLCHSNNVGPNSCPNASVAVLPQPDGSVVVQGHQYNLGDFSSRFGGNAIYFYARISGGGGLDAAQSGIWLANSTLLQGTLSAAYQQGPGSPQLGAYLTFRDAAVPVEMTLGVSFIDPAGARNNLEAEIPANATFADTLAAARAAWRQAMGVVTARFGAGNLSSAQTALQTQFFTALYHFFLSPTNWTEADGRYLGFDHAVHAFPGFHVYTDLSMWDTFRTEFPLLVLVRPDVARDVVRSLVLMNGQLAQGFPKWAFCNGDTGSMEGLFAVTMITDALQSLTVDLEGLDVAQIVQQLAQALRGREGAQWLDQGYFASASESLCFAFNDYCLAQLAASSGAISGTPQDPAMSAVAASFGNTSGNWRLLWDPLVRFLCAKDPATGDWVECQDPLFVPVYAKYPFDQRAYTEGDAWQYRWFVPGDMQTLIQLMGGQGRFVAELEKFFQASTYTTSNFLPNAFFWAGNEPDLQTPYLFNYASPPRADLTSQWVRWTMQTHYTIYSSGISGNDDYGTMSSWFVWSALGLYPDNCNSRYFLGIPLFDYASIPLSTGSNLTIVSHQNQMGFQNVTVSSVQFNSQPITSGFIDAHLIQKGGLLEFFIN